MKISTIDEYLKTLPPATQVVLEVIRQSIHRIVPQAVETISYDMPTFDLDGRHLVFVAAWKRHISLYPRPAGDAALQHAMAGYKQGRGSIQFPLDQPIPYDLIADIVTCLVHEKPAP